MNFKTQLALRGRGVSAPKDGSVVCSLPPLDVVKLNTDAAVKTGSGAVIHNSTGKVLMAVSKTVGGSLSAETGEIIAFGEPGFGTIHAWMIRILDLSYNVLSLALSLAENPAFSSLPNLQSASVLACTLMRVFQCRNI